MIDSIATELGVGTGVVYAIFALGAVQVGLQVWALVDLAGRKSVQFGRRWVWLVLILLLSSGAIGAILYLAWGRRVPEIVHAPARDSVDGDRTKAAVDALYGPDGR